MTDYITNTYTKELNCELLLLFKFNVATIHLDGPRKLKGEPRLIVRLRRNSYEIII